MQAEMGLEAAMDLVDRAHGGHHHGGRWENVSHMFEVGLRVSGLGDQAMMAGLFHHILEHTPTTAGDLLAAGCPRPVVEAVQTITPRPGEVLRELASRVRDTGGRIAIAVMAAEIAENYDEFRLVLLPVEEAASLEREYIEALELLRGKEPDPKAGAMLCVNCRSSRLIKLRSGSTVHEMMEMLEWGQFAPDAFRPAGEAASGGEDDDEDAPIWHCDACGVDFSWYRMPLRSL